MTLTVTLTLVLKLDLDILKMYLRTRNDVCNFKLEPIQEKQTDGQTDIQD